MQSMIFPPAMLVTFVSRGNNTESILLYNWFSYSGLYIVLYCTEWPASSLLTIFITAHFGHRGVQRGIIVVTTLLQGDITVLIPGAKEPVILEMQTQYTIKFKRKMWHTIFVSFLCQVLWDQRFYGFFPLKVYFDINYMCKELQCLIWTLNLTNFCDHLFSFCGLQIHMNTNSHHANAIYNTKWYHFIFKGLFYRYDFIYFASLINVIYCVTLQEASLTK
jgi:hypothetical protein